jgi:hypothetical protein
MYREHITAERGSVLAIDILFKIDTVDYNQLPVPVTAMGHSHRWCCLPLC